jgi:two-component system chemotaxis response regulator CheY
MEMFLMFFWHTHCCFGGRQVAGKALPDMAEITNIEPKTILFVEDDAVVLAAYRIRLQREGFYVQAALDGLEAMKFLHASVPDLVVLDLMLPKFNGEEVLKFIRSDVRLKKLPVIIFSTNSIIDAEQEHLLEGVSRRLIKNNCTASMLLETVRDVLSGASAENAALPADRIHDSFSTILETAAA